MGKSYIHSKVIDRVFFTFSNGGFSILPGLLCGGKNTFPRCIAGVERPYSGHIHIWKSTTSGLASG